MTSFHDAPDEWMEDDEAMEERSSHSIAVILFVLNQIIFQRPQNTHPKKMKNNAKNIGIQNGGL